MKRYGNAPRAVTSPTKRHIAERLAGMQGVSVLHFLEVVVARKRYREARRARRRRSGFTARKRGVSHKWLFAGEGRFHELMKIMGWTQEDFARYSGLSYDTVRGWYGFPMHGWPLKLVEHAIWQRNAMVKLAYHGYTHEQFMPGTLPREKSGKFPRTTEQGRALLRGLMGDEE